MAANSDCFTCTQLKKKHKSSVMCTGCQRRFCNEHHQEHRKALQKEFDGLIQQHDTIKQNLYDDTRAEHSRESQLLKKIDEWEKEMIQNIKSTAASSKARLMQLITTEKNQIKFSFTSMAEELKSNQTSSDYVDTDVQGWQRQLNDFRQKLERLQAPNSRFIDIEIKPIDWKHGISIHQSNELSSRKATASVTIPTKVQQRRRLQCINCDENFTENSGFDENYCSISCFQGGYEEEERGEDDDGCFHGDCVVSVADGSTKPVKDVRPGDALTTPNGSSAVVTMVMKYLCRDSTASMVTFDNGLVITPWHPIRINGKWTFPSDLQDKTKMECEAVYTFALDSGHIVLINGVECVTLGHHFKGDVVEHPYFGTDKVLNDLRAIDHSRSNVIELSPNSIIRDAQTRLACGIRKCNVSAYE